MTLEVGLLHGATSVQSSSCSLRAFHRTLAVGKDTLIKSLLLKKNYRTLLISRNGHILNLSFDN